MNPNAEFIGTDQPSNLFSTLNRSKQAAGDEMAGATGTIRGFMGGTVHALAGGLIGAGLGAMAGNGGEKNPAAGKRSSLRRKRVCVPGVWVAA